MINANELRISNLVYDNINQEYRRWREYDYTSNPDFYDPIPLTQDILIKCGFKDNGVRVVGSPDDIIEWIHEDAEIRKEYNKLEYVLYSDEWGDNQKSVTINSLHQLQNLYFALTNTELIINL